MQMPTNGWLPGYDVLALEYIIYKQCLQYCILSLATNIYYRYEVQNSMAGQSAIKNAATKINICSGIIK